MILHKITVHDKIFELLLSAEQIQQRVAALGRQIQADYQGKNPLLVGILNGAFIFAADLIRACEGLNMEVCFTKLSSYKGMTSSGEVATLIGMDISVAQRHVIVVEDIVDTGKTLSVFLQLIENQRPASVALAACLLKPSALQHPLTVRYCGFEIPNDFVIGYGLDYNGLGREYRAIYQLSR